MIDHATGVVIGETSTIDENVSILGVTLGGKGKTGDRHPKIKSGVSIYASSTILGNITIGKNSKVNMEVWFLKNMQMLQLQNSSKGNSNRIKKILILQLSSQTPISSNKILNTYISFYLSGKHT